MVTDNKDLGFATSQEELAEMCPKLMDGLRFSHFHFHNFTLSLSHFHNFTFTLSLCHFHTSQEDLAEMCPKLINGLRFCPFDL